MSHSSSNPGTVSGSTRVRLHPLHMRAEGESWIVGRVETGDFIAVPPVGHRAIALLSVGAVDEVRAQLRDEAGSDIDVAAFVSSLVDIGFVAELDDRPLAQQPIPEPMFAAVSCNHAPAAGGGLTVELQTSTAVEAPAEGPKWPNASCHPRPSSWKADR
jgi:hypothetical protein